MGPGEEGYWRVIADDGGGGAFPFAGLWDSWRPIDGSSDPIRTCTVITTEPNELVRDVHDRMPAILKPEHVEPWLDGGRSRGELESMLESYPADAMESFSVSSYVNSPRNDSPECIRRHEVLDLFG